MAQLFSPRGMSPDSDKETSNKDETKDKDAAINVSKARNKMKVQVVYLNVYDLVVDGKPLKHLNDLALPLGFGAFHSGLGTL